MKSTTVYLVQLSEPVREMAMTAAREAFPRAQLVPARTVAEAAQLPGQGRQLLILGGTSEVDIGLAAQTLDSRDLPRWAVVHLGRDPSDLVETVPPEEFTVRALARIFRSTLLQHELLRENLQLRGDLKTISRRINHDVRTPLGCIATVCTLLKDLPSPSSQSPEEVTKVVHDSVEEIGMLLDRVSFVLKASGDPLPSSPMAMGPVVEQVLQQLRPALEGAGMKIRQPAAWPEVPAVDIWIEFIWRNLIHNAVRHGHPGTIQLGWEQKSREMHFWVTNPGAIPASFQPRLLRPFHLLHQQASAGLGLSLVERLVSLHGGRCGYEPAPDDHALFYFTLPGVHLPLKEETSHAGSARSSLAASRAT